MTMSPKVQVAQARLRALTEGVRVWRLDERRCAVPSSTQAGHAWEITEFEPGDYGCGCPGARYRGICKHVEAVKLFVETEGELRRAEAVGGKALADAIFSVATTMAHAYQTGP